jgi:hypothetical protein
LKKAGTLRFWLAAIGLLLSAAPAFAQCAMCGTTLQDTDGPLTRGIFWSVVFLISLPYSIVAGFILFLYWRTRQARIAERERPVLRLVPAAGSVSGKEDGR